MGLIILYENKFKKARIFYAVGTYMKKMKK